LLFDPAGEYANVNVQDQTALAQSSITFASMPHVIGLMKPSGGGGENLVLSHSPPFSAAMKERSAPGRPMRSRS
jgi:hypothetical protein